MVIERTAADVGLVHDHFRADPGEAVLGEELPPGSDQGGAGGRRAIGLGALWLFHTVCL
jgi:hypothetical protein